MLFLHFWDYYVSVHIVFDFFTLLYQYIICYFVSIDRRIHTMDCVFECYTCLKDLMWYLNAWYKTILCGRDSHILWYIMIHFLLFINPIMYCHSLRPLDVKHVEIHLELWWTLSRERRTMNCRNWCHKDTDSWRLICSRTVLGSSDRDIREWRFLKAVMLANSAVDLCQRDIRNSWTLSSRTVNVFMFWANFLEVCAWYMS